MQVFDITREQYIAVLETEVETLSRYYFKPTEEGTGHYNTAIGVFLRKTFRCAGKDSKLLCACGKGCFGTGFIGHKR